MHFSLPSDFQVGCAMRFFKNASKKGVQGQWKKNACVILGGRAPKKVSFHWLRKKMEVESKKMTRKNDVLVPEMQN